VCCSMLQCVAVHCVAMCCNVLQCGAACCSVLQCVLQCVTMCSRAYICCPPRPFCISHKYRSGSVLPYIAVRCSASCCSVLQCVAVCVAVCDAVCCRAYICCPPRPFCIAHKYRSASVFQ